MREIAHWLYALDKDIFRILRLTIGSSFLEINSPIFGNILAWLPFLLFLAMVLYFSKPEAGVFSLFFGLSTFILSFQAATLLANYLLQPAPWVIESLTHNLSLPSMRQGPQFSLPDWTIAALVGTFHFVRLRLKSWQGPDLAWMWLPMLIFALLRIYAGFSYPLGAGIGICVGVLIGWLTFQLAHNIELLAPKSENDEA